MEKKINSLIEQNPMVFLQEIVAHSAEEFRKTYIDDTHNETVISLCKSYKKYSIQIYDLFKSVGYDIEKSGHYPKFIKNNFDDDFAQHITKDCSDEYLKECEKEHSILHKAYFNDYRKLIDELALKGIKTSDKINYLLNDNALRDIYFKHNVNPTSQFEKDKEWLEKICTNYTQKSKKYEADTINKFLSEKISYYKNDLEKQEELISICFIAGYKSLAVKAVNYRKDQEKTKTLKYNYSVVPPWKYLAKTNNHEYVYNYFDENVDIKQKYQDSYLLHTLSLAGCKHDMDRSSYSRDKDLKYNTLMIKIKKYFEKNDMFEKNNGVSIFDVMLQTNNILGIKIYIPVFLEKLKQLSKEKQLECIYSPLPLIDKDYNNIMKNYNNLANLLCQVTNSKINFFPYMLELNESDVHLSMEQKYQYLDLLFNKLRNSYHDEQKDVEKIIQEFIQKNNDINHQLIFTRYVKDDKENRYHCSDNLKVYLEKCFVLNNLTLKVDDTVNNKKSISKI